MTTESTPIRYAAIDIEGDEAVVYEITVPYACASAADCDRREMRRMPKAALNDAIAFMLEFNRRPARRWEREHAAERRCEAEFAARNGRVRAR